MARNAEERQPKDAVDRLVWTLTLERDAYLEWHDGPDFSAEAESVAKLSDAELKEAGDMTSARLQECYDIHLGQAAVLLGRRGDRLPQMVNALESTLRRERQNGLIEGRAKKRPMGDLLPPETAEVLLSEVASPGYLVRYHAADALLKAVGDAGGIKDNRDLFGFICGHDREGHSPPDVEDQKGFQRAVDIIKGKLTRKRSYRPGDKERRGNGKAHSFMDVPQRPGSQRGEPAAGETDARRT